MNSGSRKVERRCDIATLLPHSIPKENRRYVIRKSVNSWRARLLAPSRWKQLALMAFMLRRLQIFGGCAEGDGEPVKPCIMLLRWHGTACESHSWSCEYVR